MKRIPTIPILVFFLLLGAGCSAPRQFSSPSVPTSLPPVAAPVSSVDLRYQITPLPLSAKGLTSVDLTLSEQNVSSCYGIPGKADIFPVLQLSNRQGNLWNATTSQYRELIGQADQDVEVKIVFMTENSSEPAIRAPRELLQEQLLPTGHADLAQAVEEAVILSQQYGRPDAHPVILFFLNQKHVSSAEFTDRITRARELGFSLYAVTVPSDESQQPTLADFEGLLGPEEFVVNPDALGLRRLFVQATGGSTQLVAQDIKTTVSWLPINLFRPSLESGQGFLAVSNNVIWENSQLEAGKPRQLMIQGQIDANSAPDTVAFTAALSYTDCNGFNQNQTALLELLKEPASIIPTPIPPENISIEAPDSGEPPIPGGQTNPPGTTVTVPGGLPGWLAKLLPGLAPILPALQWVLYAVLLLAAAYLLMKYMRNFLKKPKPVSPPPPAPPHLPFKDTIPGWLKALRAEAASTTSLPIEDGNELQETILIGLGPVGREVLSDLAVLLNGRYGESWHAKVRLVYVDAVMSKNEHVTHPYELDETQYVVLRPDLEEVRKSLATSAQEWTHWDWYDYYSSSPSRANGRMALFYDLKDGTAQSSFFNIVEKASLNLSKPAIRVIGSTFDDVSSGMLVDVARLTQIILRRDLDVQLWLMGALGKDWMDPAGRRLTASEQNTRTLATLRELERFERNIPNSYTYVSKDSVNDVLRQSYDYGVVQTLFVFDPEFTSSKREEIADAMVDSLLAALSPSVNTALAKYLLDHRSRMSDVVQRQGKGVMCGIGTFSVKTANTLVEDAMAWRLVRDVLFGGEFGLYPLEHCDSNSGSYGELLSAPRASLDIGERDTIFDWFHSLDHYREWDQFVSLVTNRLNEILNGGNEERSIDIARRRKSIDLAAKWLGQLEDTAKSFPAWNVARQTEKIKKQLSSLSDWFQGELFNACQGNFDEARQRLERVRSQKRRESDIPEDLEWPEYKRYIRQIQAGSPTAGEDLLPKFGRRFGWQVRYDEAGKQWVLEWLLPPRELSWSAGVDMNDYALPYAAETVLAALHHMALSYARTGSAISAMELAKARASVTWLENAQPILSFNATEASRMAGGLNTLNILAAPRLSDPIAADDVYQRLAAVSNQRIELCETGDSSTLTILRLVSWIPFESTKMYDAELWQRRAPSTSHYVWKAEQIAANMENDHQFSALLVSMIGQDEEVLRTLGLCIIYQLISKDDDGWLLPGQNEPIPGASWSELVDSFFAQHVRKSTFKTQRPFLLQTWCEHIDEQRKQIADQKYTYFRIFIQDYLEDNLKSMNPGTRDLVKYLSALIEQEKKSHLGA